MYTYIAMTVKGKKDLTENCLRTLSRTLERDKIHALAIVDASSPADQIDQIELRGWLGNSTLLLDYKVEEGCGIVYGWNRAIDNLIALTPNIDKEQVNLWILNNDVVFRKPGWLDRLNDRLSQPGTGVVGSTSMSVFGHNFSTGGIWGFNLAKAVEVAEDGKILDERLNYCCQDVDISIRLAKVGLPPTHVPGTEYVEDPYLEHAISKTVMDIGYSRVMEIRAVEEQILIEKHGKRG